MSIQDMDEETLSAADMPFTTTSASGHVTPLTARVSRIAADNRNEYIRLALAYRSDLCHCYLQCLLLGTEWHGLSVCLSVGDVCEP